ncbi:hypothetical protein [Streptomyces goshikiensis]|uniref:hypothetical protein n=1 Tax=Streptomyces goshikiensis TaxID=1942 RepID=UPI0036C5CA6C
MPGPGSTPAGRLRGLLHDAVLARPDSSLYRPDRPDRPAVLDPAVRAWLQHVAVHGPVADTVMARADDGADPRHHLDDARWIATCTIRAVYGPAVAAEAPHPGPGRRP